LVKPQSLAEQSVAYGPGLQGGVAGEEAPFTVETPPDAKAKVKVKVIGPRDEAKVTVKPLPEGKFAVVYLPTTPGEYKIHVTVDDEHVPGSIFTVLIMEKESLGGEGKIRVFYSTTASNQKSRTDKRALETLLQAKKVHLREDFEPWHAVDIMDRDDREAVFRRAGSRKLPIVFIDDEYIGDYDDCMKLEEAGKLDALLNMKKQQSLLTEEQHRLRLKGAGQEGTDRDFEQEKLLATKKGPGGAPAAAGKSVYCKECGAANPPTDKFCASCGCKLTK